MAHLDDALDMDAESCWYCAVRGCEGQCRMPDSYDGNPLSVAKCSKHGVFDIREIRCPKCKDSLE